MQTDLDLIIIGAGCAGLSLGMQLATLGSEAPKTLLLEQRPSYENDRTWCFWGDDRTPFVSLANHSWSQFNIKTEQNSVLIDCRDTPYRLVSSSSFYQHAIESIGRNEGLSLKMGCSLLAEPSFVDNKWHLQTTSGDFSATSVVDTRPISNQEMSDTTLWQSFLGYEVECQDERFDPHTAQLMDFCEANQVCVGFTYVLPLSKTKALVEFTVFAARIYTQSELLNHLDSYVAKLTGNKPYENLRAEYGLIPMGLGRSGQALNNAEMNPTYVRVGLTAGAARPATGYAFQRIQRWAVECARALKASGLPVRHQRDSIIVRNMDAIFLRVIRNRPDLGPALFMHMFSKVKSASIIRFLSDRGLLPDYLAVILALPPGPFLKSAYQLATEK